MPGTEVTGLHRALAQCCLKCPVCNYARKKQKGLIFWFVKNIESSLCPFGKAYERVYNRKAHEPIPEME
ncbi:MAG TPA: hypothetical protein VM123_09755 [archaeon]|nr:hypothetical protein [archaeon]